MSRYSWPPVFFCRKIIRVKSPCWCTSPHVSLSMSLRLNPVRHENRNARLIFGYSHSVARVSLPRQVSDTFLYLPLLWSPLCPLSGCVQWFCHQKPDWDRLSTCWNNLAWSSGITVCLWHVPYFRFPMHRLCFQDSSWIPLPISVWFGRMLSCGYVRISPSVSSRNSSFPNYL